MGKNRPSVQAPKPPRVYRAIFTTRVSVRVNGGKVVEEVIGSEIRQFVRGRLRGRKQGSERASEYRRTYVIGR